MNTPSPGPKGLRTFIIIWIGQILSLLGTAISNFGLTLWAYDASGGESDAPGLGGLCLRHPNGRL